MGFLESFFHNRNQKIFKGYWKNEKTVTFQSTFDYQNTPSEFFQIPEKTFHKLNSARSNLSRVSTARNDDLITRLKSAQSLAPPKSARSARSKSDLSDRMNSARTVETYSTVPSTEQSGDSSLAKMNAVLDNLKK